MSSPRRAISACGPCAAVTKPACWNPPSSTRASYRYYLTDQIPAATELDAVHPPAERTGPPGGRYANDLYTDRADVMTVYRPVRTPRAEGRIEMVELPAADFAVAVHVGPHDDLDVTYGRLGAWVVSHALGVDGPVHETYVAGPRDTGDATLCGAPRSAGPSSASHPFDPPPAGGSTV